MVIKSKKEKIKLAMHRDFLERKNKMHERYPLSEIRRLQIQQGFSNINDPKLINMLVPPKKSTDGFGDDLGFDDGDTDYWNGYSITLDLIGEYDEEGNLTE